MAWSKGDLRDIEFGERRGRGNSSSQQPVLSKYEIPAPYDRIVSQLIAEDIHGVGYDSHESRRRQTYAREVLDEFGAELQAMKHIQFERGQFRSTVLTPILQRQLGGVHDAYTPFVRAAISSGTSGQEP
jgi:hypothetical protein